MLSTEDSHLRRFTDELVGRHGCHTVILYGSRARGDFGPESDYDLAGIRSDGAEIRIGESRDGVYLDAFVYPESAFADPESDAKHLRFIGGKILLDRDGFGARLMDRLAARLARGPKKLSADELRAQFTWVRKTLARARRGDIEGDFRRVWLLHELLEFAFDARGEWYRGPKESFRHLATIDPRVHALYAEALKPGAPFAATETLVAHLLENLSEPHHD